MTKTIRLYNTADYREFANPTTMFNEDLSELLMRIWINRDFLNKDDLEYLKKLTTKKIGENITISIL